MDTQRRAELIARYKDGYREVAAALDGATDEELDARPGPGQWTAREVVHHLAGGSITIGRSPARCSPSRPREAARAICWIA